MANTYKNIIITPNINAVDGTDPNISFRGANTSVNTEIVLKVYPDSNGTLSFEGNVGQLQSITNDLTGTIFSVNDISGIPSIEVNANGIINLARFGGANVNVHIGNVAVNDGQSILQVRGAANVDSLRLQSYGSVIASNGAWLGLRTRTLVSANSGATISANGINFVNTSSATVSVTSGTNGNANVSFTISGAVGAQGAAGAQGAPGTAGAQGAAGAQGSPGTAGAQGAAGAQGSPGTAGAQGAAGAQGSPGTAGAQGAVGAQGSPGTAGAQGAVGAQGSPGTAGAQGAVGAQGSPGTAGAQGAVGAQGSAGAQGAVGTPALTYTSVFGDGSNVTYTFTHNLNVSSYITEVRRVSTGILVYPDVVVANANVANVTFSITPTTNEYRLSLIGF